MHISMIWAMSANRVIGRDNTLPWRLPLDMKHFMTTTLGKPVVMGRKTLESMKSPLPGRTNIVLTTNLDYDRDGVRVVHTMEEALAMAHAQCDIDGQDELMIIGGADIYALGLPIATRLYITHVHAEVDGDVFFPEFDLGGWRQVQSEYFQADDRHSADFTIAIYERS
ncbi:MAG: dihydrofolate reductase [Pseudomonadota bacterium]